MEACDIPQDRYRVFIEDVGDAFFETNVKGDFLFFNDALCRIFGYSREEIQYRNFRLFMDEENADFAFNSFNNMFRTGKGVTGILWEIIRKDGGKRILEINAHLLEDTKGVKIGFQGIARDVTQEKRVAQSNQALFRIAKALHKFTGLEERLEYITRQVQQLIAIEGASIILLDNEKEEFYFGVTAYDDTITGQKMKQIRFPADKGVAGEVYRTGEPLIVPDTSKSPYFFRQVDDQSGYETRNMLDVPIQIQDRMIGVLCLVNKKEGAFNQNDVDLLSTIANMVALPIENARINEELRKSYEDVKSLNRAKDSVIHHLSHELKTPVSVLSASLSLLQKKYSDSDDGDLDKILSRAERNLDRILEMQYEIEDIMGQRDYRSYYLLSALLDACRDELEALVADEIDKQDAVEKVGQRIDDLFGPREAVSEQIQPDRFLQNLFESLRPRFAHRSCRIETRFDHTEPILIPADVLSKIATGLIRNAIENTPDGGLIEISLRNSPDGPEFEVKDYGVGISEENQRLIFDNYFTTYETAQYSSRKPYDFNAGGKGFDLIRIKIFSERYHFKLKMKSKRCPHMVNIDGSGPGRIDACEHCDNVEDCLDSGGTTMTVQFLPADMLREKKREEY